jgi:hypothetical protein
MSFLHTRAGLMKTPIYAIINGNAVKAVRTWTGGLDVLLYVPERDEFERAIQYLEHLYFPTGTKALDTDIVSKKEFKEFVAKLRDEARS